MILSNKDLLLKILILFSEYDMTKKILIIERAAIGKTSINQVIIEGKDPFRGYKIYVNNFCSKNLRF
jgi:hypothetical protein